MSCELTQTEPRAKHAKLWDRDPFDWYVEPEWVSERLFQVEPFDGMIMDPACGLGRIVDAAFRSGLTAFGTDIVRRSDNCAEECDFLTSYDGARNIVSNPPFGLCDPRDKSRCFVRHALKVTQYKVALLLPTVWLNSAERGAWLETTSLYRVWLLGPRPSMPPGAVIQAGEKPGNGTKDFCWVVWLKGFDGAPSLRWLRRMGK